MKLGKSFLLFNLFSVVIFLSFGFTWERNEVNYNNLGNNNSIVNGTLSINDVLYLNLHPTRFFISDSTAKSDSMLTDSTVSDTTGIIDSNIVIDSLLLDPRAVDSTARLKYFKFERHDNPTTFFNKRRESAFYVYPSSRDSRRQVKLDSTKQFVLITETIAGIQVRPELKIPIEDYINIKREVLDDLAWKQLAYKYEMENGRSDLSDLLSDITNIEIPLPSSSFLSIFGPPKISLRISGSVDIHGAWRNEKTDGLTASALGNTRNEPDFKQQVQINVSGTIGDKLTIGADWNTERTFEYENQLKLKYTGYEDEIIQSIEAGNVSLQTSPLVGGSEALFGIKAKFQMGPFSLTALASQKKSEVQEKSVSGGSQKEEFNKRAYNYSQNHFFIHEDYADTNTLNIYNDYYSNVPEIVHPAYLIKDIEVWKTVETLPTGYERTGSAFIDLPERKGGERYDAYQDSINNESRVGETIIGSRFIRLTEGQDYEYEAYTGILTLNSIQAEEAVAVAFRLEGASNSPDDDRYFGEFVADAQDTSSAIILKLVKPKNLKPTYKKAWALQLKSMYPIGGRSISEEGFNFDLNFEVPGLEPINEINGKRLLEIFGLDLTDDSKTGGPDGKFDWAPGRTINVKTGEIIFPVIQPFGKNSPLADSLRYQAVYDTTTTFAQQERDKDRFILGGEYTAAVSSVINIGFNAVENSVRVLLGGRELKEGVEYRVDYNIGQVTIMNDAALVPGADLKITYEQNDLIQLASKTLIGLRGLYEFDKKTTLGFSFLNLNQQTLSDKVRIGEEPLNNSIFGVDFKSDVELPFITKGLSYLFSTKQMSSFNLKGEFAYMNPDPNTKKSNIQGDNNLSIAYVDDFEGAKRIIPIGVTYGSWKDVSPPDDLPYLSNIQDKMKLMNYKAKSFWFNKLPSDVTVTAIWGDRKQVSRNDQTVTVLDYVFRPNKRGAFNYNADFDGNSDSLYKNWGGIMKPLSSTANNLVEENIEFIEFWMKIDDAPADSKMLIDLGQITEDVIPNGVLDTEDKNRNALVDEGEDVGLDGIPNSVERNDYPNLGSDPSLDNFIFGQGDRYNTETYVDINGTEGNAALTDIGRFPDTEDLNNNFTLDRVNSYFRYEIPIDTVRSRNDFIVGGGDGSKWYQFRIPLKDYIAHGSPSFEDIETIRLSVSGVSDEIHIRIAEFNLVGNQWQKVFKEGLVDQEDTVLTISTINIEDNPEYYPPSNNLRERDRSNPDEQIYKNEQSLNLLIRELEPGDNREIVKYLFRPLDLFNYKQMKLFVHGPIDNSSGSVSEQDPETGEYSSQVYIQFGADTANYYEYRQPIKADWDDMQINFSDLTAIKQVREDATVRFEQPVPGREGHFYAIKGNPALTKVTYFLIGIKNNRSLISSSLAPSPVNGDVWINEMRVLGADDKPGWAYSAASSIKLADLISVNANISETDPYFHKLAARFGSRSNKKSWAVSTNIDVIKLLPVNLSGSNLKVNYSHNESQQDPLYQPGTDILVDKAAEQRKNQLKLQGLSDEAASKAANQMITEFQTVNVRDTWSLSGVQIQLPSNKWYIRDTFNKLKWNFNYNKSFSRTPTIVNNSSWVWTAGMNYNVNFSKDLFFYPANIPVIGWLVQLFSDYRNAKIYFTPRNLAFGFSANRKYAFSKNRNSDTEPNIQRDFTAKRNLGFVYKLSEEGLLNANLNYSANFQSSLAHLLVDNNGGERNEKEIWNDIFGGQFFGRDYNFQQQVDFKISPKLPSIWSINKYISFNTRYNVNYTWQNNFQQEEVGRSAGYSNSISAGFSLRLKSLAAPLFAEEVSKKSNKKSRNNSWNSRVKRRIPTRGKDVDVDKKVKNANTKSKDAEKTDSLNTIPKTPIFVKALSFMKGVVKWVFFDYDQISFNFSQNNSKSGSGLAGKGTGFKNFWGFTDSFTEGPNRGFMLGISNDLGPRAPNGNLSDNFTQKNNVDFKTSRPLWENASIDINWKVGWGMNKTTTINTDELGNVTISNITSTGNINRSFLTLPSFLSFGLVKSGVVRVNELYVDSKPNPTDANAKLSNAFIEGFESIPLLSQLPILSDVAKFVPRPNWRISWNGLEKLPLLKNFAKRVTLNHGYTSSYIEGWRISPDGVQETQSQKISYGFAPLIGLNVTMDKILGGNLTGSFKYSTKAGYDLGSSTRNITETFSKDINVTASFSKSGFELPLFGLSLKNDIEASISYTSGQNSVVVYEMDNFKEGGKPQDGTIRTTIEPRIKYVMSARVTLALFYKRTSVEPQGASRIPPTTTNEAGLDVHIAIQ